MIAAKTDTKPKVAASAMKVAKSVVNNVEAVPKVAAKPAPAPKVAVVKATIAAKKTVAKVVPTKKTAAGQNPKPAAKDRIATRAKSITAPDASWDGSNTKAKT